MREVKTMKMFAIDYLSDILGKSINRFLPAHVSGFANFIAYIINREIDLADHLDSLSIESMVRNGVFGHGAGNGYGEHLVPIRLQFRDFVDEFDWDLCNPDNQPEEFAATLVSDLDLKPREDFLIAISYEIRKQLSLYCCKKVQHFVSVYENYVATEIENLENFYQEEKEFPPKEIMFAGSKCFENTPEQLQLKANEVDASFLEDAEKIFTQGRFTDKMIRPLISSIEISELPHFLVQQNVTTSTEEDSLDNIEMLAGIALRHHSYMPHELSSDKQAELAAAARLKEQ